MLIKTGILCIPALDEPAIGSVRRLLRSALENAHVVEEGSALSQRHWIEDLLRRWSDEEELDLIITIGGTLPAPGPSSAEIVPEATIAVLERSLPGLCEAMRAHAQHQTALALLDRGVAGIRGRTLILNLPGGAGPATLFLDAVLGVLEPIILHLQDHPDAPTMDASLPAVDVATEEPASTPATPAQDASPSPGRSQRLDPEEFAAFLAERKTGKAPGSADG